MVIAQRGKFVYLIFDKKEFSKAAAVKAAKARWHEANDCVKVTHARKLNQTEYAVELNKGNYWCVQRRYS